MESISSFIPPIHNTSHSPTLTTSSKTSSIVCSLLHPIHHLPSHPTAPHIYSFYNRPPPPTNDHPPSLANPSSPPRNEPQSPFTQDTSPPSHTPQPEPPIDDEPLYVNAKQYYRILKRRVARARLEEVHRLSQKRKVPTRISSLSNPESHYFTHP